MVDITEWQFSVPTEVGVLTVLGNASFVTAAGFAGHACADPVFDRQRAVNRDGDCALKTRAQQQLAAYLSGTRLQFDLPVMAPGSSFQQSVWRALADIPSGQTRTYGDLAKMLGSSARAVGGACRRNPVAVIVPCHRVVAANGPGGYGGKTAGQNMCIKSWLLQHEA